MVLPLASRVQLCGAEANWYSAGGRISLAFARHAKLLGEAGYDEVTKNNGSALQYLAKFTGAVAITADRGFMARPELRLFYTWATWNETAQIATIDSGGVYTNTYPNLRSGATFGLQAETWF